MRLKSAGFLIVNVTVLASLLAASLALPGLASPLGEALGEATPAPAVPGCSTDATVLRAIGIAVTVALTSHPMGDERQVWRLHSVCRRDDWAYAYVKGYWLDSGLPLPSPSEVMMVRRTPAGWKAALPQMTAEYSTVLNAAPESLLPPEAKALLMPLRPGVALLRFNSYSLPWPAGESAYVIKHWYPAIDFSIGGASGATGTIRNAKAGTAVFVKDSSTRECGDPPPDWVCWMWANTVVIQTGPTEYAWYLHMAPDSVPDWLQEGSFVPAGVDIGTEGTTGWAAGAHLHFQVADGYACCTGEGDSRMPVWPMNTTYQVDFAEYTWENLPYWAVSTNGRVDDPPPNLPPDDANTEPPPQPPAGEAPPPPPQGGSSCTNPYIVQPGDWLLKIADTCGVSLAQIVEANPGIMPNTIYPGQAINLPGGAATPPPPPPEPTQPPAEPPPPPPTEAPPAPQGAAPCTGTHVVQGGENLFRIGYNCGFSTEQMAAANGIYYPYTIYPGQVLRFP